MIQIGSTKFHYGTYLNRFLHLGVVLMYCVLIINIIILPQKFPNMMSHRIMRHGYEYRNYLFSIWGTIAQFVYFCMYVAMDILEIQGGALALKIKEKMQNIASYLLFTFVFPLSVHIFILFWCFYVWDREYIYPRMLDEMAPFWLNHILHTYPPVLSVIYMLTCNENEPSIKSTFSGLSTLLVAYSALFLYVKAVHGVWIYQAFDAIEETFAKFLLFYCGFGSLPFLFLGHKLNKVLTGLKEKFLGNMSIRESSLHEKTM
ncbi:androgen-induced gene 1 protein-like [Rhodnius prolixus]|uniref:androgen-induced gene 1 protein-like n=1 Tax=Rhodnius prolixus TaxID=13249 RepID=UPI003D18C867